MSASAELFERAAEAGAQLVLVHHGLFWEGMPQHIDAALHRRLKPLFAHDMALAAYHLPLDAHPEHGNNALLADGAGLRREREPLRARGPAIGIAGTFDGDGIAAAELLARVRERDRPRAAAPRLRARARPDARDRLGRRAPTLARRSPRGHDAFLTGEPAERVMTQAREAGIHFFAAGHYATETFGVRRLGELLSRGVRRRHLFIDDPNPI